MSLSHWQRISRLLLLAFSKERVHDTFQWWRRKWQLVNHPETVSPWEDAAFINFFTILKLTSVTVGNSTFAEWEGEKRSPKTSSISQRSTAI